MRFVKMHGIGNDYIYFDCLEKTIKDPASAAVRLCDRHFSVGGDGIVLILPSERADAKMRMFNADGSEGKMCGNAIRCVGKYLYERRGMAREQLKIETLSGVRTLYLHVTAGTVQSVTVDMGAPSFEPARIPTLFPAEAVGYPLTVGEKEYRVTCLSMGNPHCVVFCEDPNAVDLEKVGPLFGGLPVFPEGVNVEFVRAEKTRLAMRVWERGSGETLACGTGACAAAVAAIKMGYARTGEDIEVRLAGGNLHIMDTGSTVLLTGPAEYSFEGETALL